MRNRRSKPLVLPVRPPYPVAPHIYNREIGAKILELIAEEGIGLKTACDRLGLQRRTVRNWSVNSAEFANALALARAEALEVWAEQIIEISDKIERHNDPEMTRAAALAARVKIDSRKWLLARLRPDLYGDRVQLTGKDGRDLIPETPEGAVPRLMKILAILLPSSANSELYDLATAMAGKLTALPTQNGADHEEEEEEVIPPGYRPNDRPN